MICANGWLAVNLLATPGYGVGRGTTERELFPLETAGLE
jgi:hypothetical protein